jgi:hypothetical protein
LAHSRPSSKDDVAALVQIDNDRVRAGVTDFPVRAGAAEYELVVHPRIVGHGPKLFAGLSKLVDLKLVGRQELRSGAVAMQYETR